MSTKERLLILDSENATIGEKAARPRPQGVVRRKLADISNLPQNQKLIFQEDKPRSIETTTKEYIDQLQKENMALMKMLSQGNKIIEQSGIELDRLRVDLLKMQEQNQQLALSNTQMLAELNSGKYRLKVLQHELGCKNGLVKARKLELEEKTRITPCKNADVKEEGESSMEGRGDEQPHKTKRSLQSNSLSSSEQVQSTGKTENKRPSVRRQSARLKAAEPKPAEDLFGLGDTEVPGPLPDDSHAGKGSTSENASIKNADNEGTSDLRYGYQEFGRSSLRRPSRLAAKKVQSYRERPLNLKMRRPE